MSRKYEASYAGYVHEKPASYWTSEEHLKSRLLEVDFTGKGAIKAGGMPVISDGLTAFVDARDGHTAVIAPSGMKKSICCFMPLIYTLGRAGEIMVITDPKGELYQRTAGNLAREGYQIYCLDFRDMDKDFYNILEYPTKAYRTDRDRGLSLLSDIVNALAENQRKSAKDPFWPDTGAQYCNATAAMMIDAYPAQDLINVLNWCEFNTWDSAMMLREFINLLPDGNTVKTSLKGILSSADNTLRSILVTATSFLSMFNQNNKLACMLSSSTFSLEDLLKEKTALYIVTDDTTTTADPIVGIILSQIQNFLIDRAFHNGGSLDTRFNFILDEFASFEIPNMDKALATHRSRNIRYYLCVQTYAGLKFRYENPEALLSNCGTTMFLGSTELEMLKIISEQLGSTSITSDGKEKPLAGISDLMNLKKTWDEKEALYLNLPESIRYCATLPSIEAYGIENVPAPEIRRRHRGILPYTLDAFFQDMRNKRVRIPFSESRPVKR